MLYQISPERSDSDCIRNRTAHLRRKQGTGTEQEAGFLPADIQWHFIGHLQTNKVKYIAPYIAMIHAVDSYKLLAEIDKQAAKCNRVIPCLLEIHIAEEESKYGFSFEACREMLETTRGKS